MTAEEIKKHYETGFASSPIKISNTEIEVLKQHGFSCECCHETIDNMYDFPEINTEERSVICEECYRDQHMEACPICEESYDTKDYEETHIVVTKELAREQRMKPGIYEILKRPFFFGNILTGFDSFFNNTLKLVAQLDVDALKKIRVGDWATDVGSGCICPECVEKYTNFSNYINKDGRLCILIEKHKDYFKEYTPERLRMERQRAIHRRITERGIIQNSEIKDEK